MSSDWLNEPLWLDEPLVNALDDPAVTALRQWCSQTETTYRLVR
ncbi:hypothetical protein [Frankia sp. CcWB2]